ncbi:MAG TPA: MFS transporter [Candidatus Limnocylindrales bacterium]|nr:MFS transporter [Candidatus Limnocylindrales bacterium]
MSVRTRLGGGLPASFWRLWLASAASNLSDGMFWVALPLLAVTLTDSPVLIAGVVVASRLPWLLFALVAGALADRLDRRRTMILVDIFRGGLLGALAVATFAGVASLPILYIVAFALGVAETLFDTSAQSIMPNIVESEQLSLANSRLYAVELMMNQFVGPPLGGFLAAVGTAIAFGAGAAAYLIAAMAIFTIVGSFRPVREGPPTRIHEDIAEGLRYLIGHPLLRVLAIMVGVGNLANSAVFAVLVLYVVAPGPLGLDEVGFGLLMTAGAVGSLGGTFVVAPLERRLGRANLLAISMVGFSIPLLVPGLTTSLPLVAGAMVLGGFIGIAWNVVTVSLRQRIVPDRLLGRVNASYRLLAWGTIPVGAALGGFIGEAFGLRAVFLIFGVVEFLLIFGRFFVTEDAIRAAEAGAAPAQPVAADPAV